MKHAKKKKKDKMGINHARKMARWELTTLKNDDKMGINHAKK